MNNNGSDKTVQADLQQHFCFKKKVICISLLEEYKLVCCLFEEYLCFYVFSFKDK